MCGIAGFIGKKKVTPQKLEKCFELMNRRGPDAKGEYYLQKDSILIFFIVDLKLLTSMTERINHSTQINQLSYIMENFITISNSVLF